MKLFWSIGALEPADVLARRIPGTEDAFAPSFTAARKILDAAKASANENRASRILQHVDAMRATTVLHQILLRKPTIDRAQLEVFAASCRDGINICRSLVPKVLCRVEDKLEALVAQYPLLCKEN
jgi:hypothetical protein